jgi:hypothetical protein
MSDRKALAWALAELRSMRLRHPLSLVLKSELPLCDAWCRDGHACQAKAAWDGIEPYNGRCRIHGGLSTGPRTQEGRDRLSAATKKTWPSTLMSAARGLGGRAALLGVAESFEGESMKCAR